MKRITLLVYLATFAIAAFAGPAKPGKVQHTQSDGTVVTYELQGDEFNNRIVVDGTYTAVKAEDGDLYYAALQNGYLVSSGLRIKADNLLNAEEKKIARQSIGIRRTAFNPTFNSSMHSFEDAFNSRMAVEAARADGLPNESALEVGRWGGEVAGKRNMLVILVEYTDIKFSIEDPQDKFSKMLNTPGYSENGATGSARDYFVDSSSGKFEPTFDVVGPYTLPNNRKYYGGNKQGSDQAPAMQANDACDLADANGVDFSKYDYNNDGAIDLVFIVYAGHNEAEHGPADSVWPHMWDIYPGANIAGNSYPVYDGKKFTVYACTSELKGSYGTDMTGIGSFCHEFSHAIGLPDLYDTEGGNCFGMSYASIMHAGNYLNDSRTPPTYSILERWLVGWTFPKQIQSAGVHEMKHVSQNDGYIIWANDAYTECFLFENRTKAANWKWDATLNNGDRAYGFQGGEGMLVYHIDWTGSYLRKWQGNSLNTTPTHECARLVRSNPNADDSASKGWFYPGSRNITELTYDSTPSLRSWAQEKLPYNIVDINIKGSSVFFNAHLKDLIMNPGQYDALIDWEASETNANSWKVVFKNDADGSTHEYVTTNKYITLYPLQPSTKYSAAIYADDQSEPTYEFTFETLSNVIAPRSALQVNSTQSKDDFLHLRVKNLEFTPSTITWYIDGKQAEPYVKLAPGTYQICAAIVDTKGSTHYLYRYTTIQ